MEIWGKLKLYQNVYWDQWMESTTKPVLFTASSENPLLWESDNGLIPEETKINILHTEEDVDYLQPSDPLAREIDFDVSNSDSHVLRSLQDG